ncbi:3204_t:CDS:2 [Dentiscutata heterogama]|uniref:3204_t:CDS:1 n=1 Tax=Dentiscutata heterogama TaxID=1316150 RepID=A0ACA9KNV0_9GLOM|nr:3204_t:CDS:2 [Dentiscutata heterogama]
MNDKPNILAPKQENTKSSSLNHSKLDPGKDEDKNSDMVSLL